MLKMIYGGMVAVIMIAVVAITVFLSSWVAAPFFEALGQDTYYGFHSGEAIKYGAAIVAIALGVLSVPTYLGLRYFLGGGGGRRRHPGRP